MEKLRVRDRLKEGVRKRDTCRKRDSVKEENQEEQVKKYVSNVALCSEEKITVEIENFRQLMLKTNLFRMLYSMVNCIELTVVECTKCFN